SFLMSLPTPLSDKTMTLSTGASRKSLVSAVIDGLTKTKPDTAAPFNSASRNARQAPIDKPMTKISLVDAWSSPNARSTSAYQSSHLVRFISCQMVPWPGSLGRLTVSPSDAKYSPHKHSDWKNPVNP